MSVGTPAHTFGPTAHSVPLSFLDQITENVESVGSIIASTMDTLLEDTRKDLFRLLSSHPQWKPYANDVRATWDSQGIDYSFYSQEAMDLEYGSPEVPAHPLVRSFATSKAHEISQQLSKSIAW